MSPGSPERRPEFGKPHDSGPVVQRFAAYGILEDSEGRVLVVSANQGLFLPGGGREPGESAARTVRREFAEETAMVVDVGRRLGTVVQHFSARAKQFRAVFDFFEVRLVQPGIGSGEHEILWLSPAGLRGRMYHESHEWAARLALDDHAS